MDYKRHLILEEHPVNDDNKDDNIKEGIHLSYYSRADMYFINNVRSELQPLEIDRWTIKQTSLILNPHELDLLIKELENIKFYRNFKKEIV